MSHPFGDLLSQHLHRKHGFSQSKLAEAILQDPSVIGKMCKGHRLTGLQARKRVLAIADYLRTQRVLATVAEANALLAAAGMSPLSEDTAEERALHTSHSPTSPRRAVDVRGSATGVRAHTSPGLGWRAGSWKNATRVTPRGNAREFASAPQAVDSPRPRPVPVRQRPTHPEIRPEPGRRPVAHGWTGRLSLTSRIAGQVL